MAKPKRTRRRTAKPMELYERMLRHIEITLRLVALIERCAALRDAGKLTAARKLFKQARAVEREAARAGRHRAAAALKGDKSLGCFRRANGEASSAFATQELAHCSGVTHEEAFNVRRLIAGFSLNLPQEWRGVLVCSRREVKGQNVSLKAAAVHGDIIVFTAEMTEHSFKLMLYCDMSAGLHIDARHSHAIPNWRIH
jgi:hypothetical protein